MTILGISGSLRAGSFNTRLLQAAAACLPAGAALAVASIGDLPHYNQDDDGEQKPAAVTRFLQQLQDADALLIATPEFNHAMPGVLKNALDWASRPAFQSPLLGKPCGILTASMSPVGGARAQLDVKNALLATLSLVFPAVDYLLPAALEQFNDAGHLTNPDAARRLQRYVENFVAWAAIQTAAQPKG